MSANDAKRTLAASGISKIIAACAKHGVTNFELDGLKIAFSPKKPEISQVLPVIQASPVAPEPLTREELAQLEYEREQARMDHLKLTDPLAYERALERDDTNSSN